MNKQQVGVRIAELAALIQRRRSREARMRGAALATVLLICGAFECRAQNGFASVQGKQFVSPSGQPLLLKGINLGNWLLPEGYMFKFGAASSPRLISTVVNQLVGEDEARRFWKKYRDSYVTKEDIQFIKKSGFNSVRIPFNYRLLVTEGSPPTLEGEGYALLDRVIRWCREEGLYVILDMHAAPGGQTGDNIDDSWGYPFLYESAESQELTIRIWEKLAARYRVETTVLGFDLLNEPIAHFFDVQELNPRLEPLYKRIVAAIRRVDDRHIIFLGGAQWDSNFNVFGPPFDSKVAYTFHKYWTDPVQSVIQEYIDFSDKYQVPIWMGESGENNNDWIRTFRTLLDKNRISWCFWPYKKLDSSSCPVSIRKPDGWDAIVKFADSPRTKFEDVRKARPKQAEAANTLNQYLENIQFRNCTVNSDYLKALGL